MAYTRPTVMVALLLAIFGACLLTLGKSVYTSELTTTYPFDTEIPTGFAWRGGSGMTYEFGDPQWGLKFSALHLTGNGDGGRGFESTFNISTPTLISVSFLNGNNCSDVSLSVFPQQNKFYWGNITGRIAGSFDCSRPRLYGEVSAIAVCPSIEVGKWYTVALFHNPVAGTSSQMVFEGKDVDVLAVDPDCVQSIDEAFEEEVMVGLASDNDFNKTPVINLIVHEGIASPPTSVPTSRPTSQPSVQPTSSPTGQPTGRPTGRPTSQPTGQPTGQPTSQPSGQPTSAPSRFAKKRSYRLPRTQAV